jgi:hypothetical protein
MLIEDTGWGENGFPKKTKFRLSHVTADIKNKKKKTV